MLFSSARLCAFAAICLAANACTAPTNHEMVASPAPPPELEEPLSLTVEALDVRHGSLRIEASMLDGSADVSMWLGEACESREVGRGIATPSTFAWSLSRDEVARAIECSLIVRVRGVDDDGNRVRRTAELPVSVGLEADGAESARLSGQEAAGASTKMTFLAPVRARRLHVAGSVIGADDDDDDLAIDGAFASTFEIGNDDLARSIFGRRRLTLLGEHFLATIAVGSMALDVAAPEVEVVSETCEHTEE
jgi:hypothetical protein